MAFRSHKADRRKKGSRHRDAPVPFPVPVETITGVTASQKLWFHYTATLQDNLVIVNHTGDLTCLYQMGFFGRGLFSRGLPTFYRYMPVVNVPADDPKATPDSLRIMRRRMYIRHRAWQKSQAHGTDDWQEDEFDSDVEYEVPGAYPAGERPADPAVGPTSPPSHQAPTRSAGDQSSSCDNAETPVGMEGANAPVYTDLTTRPDATWSLSNTDASWEIPVSSLHNLAKQNAGSKQSDPWDNMEADVDFWTSDNTQAKVRYVDELRGAMTVDHTTTKVRNVDQSEITAMECEITTLPSDVCDRSSACDSDFTGRNCSIGNGAPVKCVQIKVVGGMNSSPVTQDSMAVCDETGDAHECTHTDTNQLHQVTDCLSNNSIPCAGVNSSISRENHTTEYSRLSSKVETDLSVNNLNCPENVNISSSRPSCMGHTEDGASGNTISSASPEHTTGTGNNVTTEAMFKCELTHTDKVNTHVPREVTHPYCSEDDVDGEYLVIDDSDIEDGPLRTLCKDTYAWTPVLKHNPYSYMEPLLLTLEEAFFLAYGLGCLTVRDSNQKPLSLTSLWQTLCGAQRSFVPSYVAYHYLRSRGWVPKPGLLFGVDFILYKEGPPFYHGSYSVVVKTVHEGTLRAVEGFRNRPPSWNSFTGLNRVTEHVAKDLMFCYVILPRDLAEESMQSPSCISKFKVKLQVSTRWILSQEREKAKTSEELLPASP